MSVAKENMPPGAPSSDPSEPAFEEILARLEDVVMRLERGDLPLEESLRIFEEGISLSRLGARRLSDAERRVELLLEGDEPERTLTSPQGAR